MKHVVREIVSSNRKETLGYGVFPHYQVISVSETGKINITECSDPEDTRSLHKQGKVYKLTKLCTTLNEAGLHARTLSTQRFK